MIGGASREAARRPADWAGDLRSYALLWGLPKLAILVAVALDAETRTLVWVVSLVWMGLACLTNARRCGRTHCHFTGPFYLALAGLVALHGSGLAILGDLAWWWLGGAALTGGPFITLATERRWGRSLPPRR